MRYVALRAGDGTLVEAVRTRGGTVRKSRFLKGGAFGIPLVACDGSTGGLSRNGRRLVVYASDSGGAPKTRFLVLDPKTLRIRSRVTLNGAFGFDALSPDGSLMYLIQLKSLPSGSGFAYDVRALDVDRERLYPGAIVDRREPGEKMTGIPMTRVGSADASWAPRSTRSRAAVPSSTRCTRRRERRSASTCRSISRTSSWARCGCVPARTYSCFGSTARRSRRSTRGRSA